MAHLIDKDALVADITHKIKVLEAFVKNFDGISDKVEKARNKIEALGDVLLFLDTLEVKEVDLEKYYHDFLQKEWFGRTISEMMAFTAKHFFELGLKTQKEE